MIYLGFFTVSLAFVAFLIKHLGGTLWSNRIYASVVRDETKEYLRNSVPKLVRDATQDRLQNYLIEAQVVDKRVVFHWIEKPKMEEKCG